MNKLRRIHWQEGLEPGANVRHELPRLMADYFTIMRELLMGDPAPRALHRARLESKRVRYTLELFRPCYGPGLEARLEALRRVQQVLGDVNDAAATRLLLGKHLTAAPHGPALQDFLDTRAAAHTQAFREEWTEVFDAPGRFEWWIGYLARCGRNPSSSAGPA